MLAPATASRLETIIFTVSGTKALARAARPTDVPGFLSCVLAGNCADIAAVECRGCSVRILHRTVGTKSLAAVATKGIPHLA